MGFFTTSFYLTLWGMLDHLTAIARQVWALDLDERRCGITSKRFWQTVAAREPTLQAIVKKTRVAQWISQMSDVRHPAAHTAMLLPTSVVQETAESQKTDAEIIAELRKEDPGFFQLLDPHDQAPLLPSMIEDWRHRHRKTIAENVIYVPGKGYVRPAVNSLDYDLAMLTGMMDIFLFAVFRNLATSQHRI
jgi:hypothetical protein